MVIVALLSAMSAFSVLPEASQAELERCGVDKAALESYLALDYRAFDQDFSGGWRAVEQQQGCGRAAAELIKAYMLYSTPTPPESWGVLRWHAGQALANAGAEAEAIPFFQASYHRTAKTGEPDEWNLYVDATIAFLARDEEALLAAREALAAFPVPEEEKEARRKFLEDNPRISMPPGFVDEPSNLSVVDGFVACADKSYKEAYGRACQDKARGGLVGKVKRLFDR
ncbi:MAG: hypothetical protein HRU11_06505 [Parvularculaceae bacterium]|nr:hypothetical protein [Parvularculaceae bacterium]